MKKYALAEVERKIAIDVGVDGADFLTDFHMNGRTYLIYGDKYISLEMERSLNADEIAALNVLSKNNLINYNEDSELDLDGDVANVTSYGIDLVKKNSRPEWMNSIHFKMLKKIMDGNLVLRKTEIHGDKLSWIFIREWNEHETKMIHLLIDNNYIDWAGREGFLLDTHKTIVAYGEDDSLDDN